ncbi:hypothetical protein VPJ68_11110, partial [Parabacteroides distasonis]
SGGGVERAGLGYFIYAQGRAADTKRVQNFQSVFYHFDGFYILFFQNESSSLFYMYKIFAMIGILFPYQKFQIFSLFISFYSEIVNRKSDNPD